MNSKPSDIQARLERLYQNYARQLPEKIDKLDQLWQTMLARPDSETRMELIRLCHTLAGSGASYGFEQVTERCRRIEEALLATGEQAGEPDNTLSQQIHEQLIRLRQLARQAPDSRLEPPSATTPAAANRLVYILDEADHYAHDLAAEIHNYGYTIELFDELHLLQQQLQQQRPAAILLSCSVQNMEPQELARFSALSEQAPTLLITDNGDTVHRLQAVRSGIQGYFLMPVNIIDLIDALDHYV